MNQDLRDLYQEVILEHGRNPRNYHELSDATNTAEGYNPLCGDKVKIYVQVKDNSIEQISFTGCGCAISQASASMLTNAVAHKKINEVLDIFTNFHNAMMCKDITDFDKDSIGKLQVLLGVREFPMRIKCATLAWHTLKNALIGESRFTSGEND